MITYQKSSSWQRTLIGGVVACGLVGAGWWLWSSPSASSNDAQVASSASGAAAGDSNSSVLGMSSASFAASAPTNEADGRPSDFSPAVWSALNQALSKRPGLKPEIERVMSYMRFQRTFEYWQSLEDARDVQQRHQLAKGMLEQMPDRLAKGEFTLIEATMMTAAMLSDLVADEKKREEELEAWNKKLSAISPMPTDDQQLQEVQKKTEEKRRAPEMLFEWAKNPDQIKLEQALEESQRSAH